MAQDLDIDLDDKTLKLSLMPYEGGGLVYRSFVERMQIHLKSDHIKFIKLIEYLLQDYDVEYFYEDYNGFKILFDKKTKSLKELVRSIDAVKEAKRPFVEKLNIVVGTVNQIKANSPYLVVTFEQQGPHSFPFFIYLHDHFYDLLQQLKGKQIACFGYVTKEKDWYKMEVLSITHQIAFLSNDVSRENLRPFFDKERFLSQLFAPAKKYATVSNDRFQRSYYEHELQQFDSEYQALLQQNWNKFLSHFFFNFLY